MKSRCLGNRHYYSRGDYMRVMRRAFCAHIVRQIMPVAIAIIFAIGVIVFLIITDCIVQIKTIMSGN